MRNRNWGGCGLAVVLALGVAGCQTPAPFSPSHPAGHGPRPVSTRTTKPVTEKPPHPTKGRATVGQSGQTVLAGLKPPDSLTSCRPASQQPISVTRFLEVEEEQAPSNQEDEIQDGLEIEFQLPEALPGADAPPLEIPEVDAEAPFEEQRRKIREAYHPLPPLPEPPIAPEEAELPPVTLAELQEIAYANSPQLAAAAARVEQARGRMIQVGLYPNPDVGYQADTAYTDRTAGYHGMFARQTIVTADKLEIRRSVEWQEVLVAEIELRRAEIDLATEVRRNYFEALIAQERFKFARELVGLFRTTYQAQIDLVAGGEAAPYEPLQFRAMALNTQNAAIRAGNDYTAAWRQLAAALNRPDFLPRALEGFPEMPVPQITHEEALELLLARHTDLAIAQTRITQNAVDLRLQQVTPIPDVDLSGAVFYDDTTDRNDVAFNLQVGVRLPVFDKNQGNIYAAQSQIVESHQRLSANRNELTAQLAEAYARYLTQQAIAENYREEILPDQVRFYRGLYERYQQGAEEVDFDQILGAQQQVALSIPQYLDALSAQWQAVVDLAELLQADDLFSLDQGQPAGDTFPQREQQFLLPPDAEGEGP